MKSNQSPNVPSQLSNQLLKSPNPLSRFSDKLSNGNVSNQLSVFYEPLFSNTSQISYAAQIEEALLSFNKVWNERIERLINDYLSCKPNAYYALNLRFKLLGPDIQKVMSCQKKLLAKEEKEKSLEATEYCLLALSLYNVDKDKCAFYAEKAVQHGEGHAYEILGRLAWNSDDHTRPNNLESAKKYFELGASRGCDIAVGLLGDITIDPLEEYGKAEQLHLQAARNNISDAIISLILMYSSDGTEKFTSLQLFNLSIKALQLGSFEALGFFLDLHQNHNKEFKLDSVANKLHFYHCVYYSEEQTYDRQIKASLNFTLCKSISSMMQLASKDKAAFIELIRQHNWQRVEPFLPPYISQQIITHLFFQIQQIKESILILPNQLTHLIISYLLEENYIVKEQHDCERKSDANSFSIYNNHHQKLITEENVTTHPSPRPH